MTNHPSGFFYISFFADLKLKIKSTKKPWHYQFKCLFILRFWHRWHFHCLKLFETLHLPENESKHEVSKIWVVRQIVLKTTRRGKLHWYKTFQKMLTPYKWHVTYDTQYEKDESVNQWGNKKGACKTAMAKKVLLKSICCAIFMKVVRILCS